MSMMSNSNNNNTSLTKVFVGGLAWETPKEAIRDHFQKYGHILEAVIISDKLTGRSKGYGFITFKDADAAQKACADPTPIINGRRANCNLAALGTRRPPPPPPQPRANVGARVRGCASAAAAAAAQNEMQWYLPPVAVGSPFHHHQIHPFYGYSPAAYIAATDINYNHTYAPVQKLGFSGGSYWNGGHFGPGQAVVGPNTVLPMYHCHQSQAMGLPAHMFSPISIASAGPMPHSVPVVIMSKPTSFAPPNAAAIGKNMN